MALVSARCTHCGGNLRLDGDKKYGICPYCSSEFLVEDAINNYYGPIHGNVHADVANFFSSNQEFQIEDGWIKRYIDHSNKKEIRIPNGIIGIGKDAFAYNKNIEKVILPATIKAIGSAAFSGCENLSEIVFEKGTYGVEIGDRAFKNCRKLSNINCFVITKFGFNSFSGSGLKTVEVFQDAIIDRGAFEECKELESAYIAESFYSSFRSEEDEGDCKEREIPGLAFKGCDKLTTVELPNDLKRIDWMAFKDCKSLRSVSVPSSCEELYENAFEGCDSLPSVSMSRCTKVKFVEDPLSEKQRQNLTPLVYHDGGDARAEYEQKKATIEALDKSYSWFLKKQNLYSEYERIADFKLPLIENYIKNRGSLPLKVLSIVFGILSVMAVAGIILLLWVERVDIKQIDDIYETMKLYLSLAELLFPVVVPFIVLTLCYIGKYNHAKTNRKYFAKRLQTISNQLEQYYQSYGSCPVPLEFSDPRVISNIRARLERDEAGSIKDAITILLMKNQKTIDDFNKKRKALADSNKRNGAAEARVFVNPGFF